jgi:DNA (cytosine-5)-methyltransferase 1
MNIFKLLNEDFKFDRKKDTPIYLFEAFAGIGCQRMALNRLIGKENVVSVGISEIDKFALMSYEAIHGDLHNYGDITEINGKDLPEIDILTWSFPCQDLSKAGQQKGLKNTRSGLGFQVIRILKEMKTKPKVLLMENVPDLISIKFKDGWRIMFNEIEKLGYSNYVETLNAKDYGVAQNRNRIFMVSILGDYNYNYPTPFKLKKHIKDYLETNVDEKYFLSDKQVKSMQHSTYAITRKKLQTKKYSKCVEVEVFDYRYDEGWREKQNPNISTTITTKQGGGFSGQPLLKIKEKTKKGYSVATDGDGVYIDRPHQKRGVVQKGMIQTIKTSGADIGVVVKDKRNQKEKLADNLIESGAVKGGEVINHSYSSSRLNKDRNPIESNDGIMPALTTRADTLGIAANTSKLRIRKLTPKECWRLMGIDDDCFLKAEKVVSNSQLYKQAGNGIVIDVLYHIFRKLFN